MHAMLPTYFQGHHLEFILSGSNSGYILDCILHIVLYTDCYVMFVFDKAIIVID